MSKFWALIFIFILITGCQPQGSDGTDDGVPDSLVVNIPTTPTPILNNQAFRVVKNDDDVDVAGACTRIEEDIHIYVNDEKVAETPCNSTRFIYNYEMDTDGVYDIKVLATHEGETPSDFTPVFKFIRDTDAPDPPVISAGSSFEITPTRFFIRGSCDLTETNEHLITIYLNNSSVDTVECNGGVFQYMVDRTVQDTYEITARATDEAGNRSEFSGAVEWILDTVIPFVTNVDSTTAAGTYGEGQTITINITFNEDVVVSGDGPVLELNTRAMNLLWEAGIMDHDGPESFDLGHSYVDEESITVYVDGVEMIKSEWELSRGTGTNDVDEIVVDVSEKLKGGEVITVSYSYDKRATFVSESNGVLTFTYTTSANDFIQDLGYVSTSSLILPTGTTIRDLRGYDADNRLPPPGQEDSLSYNEAIAIDAYFVDATLDDFSAYTGQPYLVVSGTCDSSDGTETVSLYINGELKETVSCFGGRYKFSNYDPGADGKYTVEIDSTDAAGNSMSSTISGGYWTRDAKYDFFEKSFTKIIEYDVDNADKPDSSSEWLDSTTDRYGNVYMVGYFVEKQQIGGNVHLSVEEVEGEGAYTRDIVVAKFDYSGEIKWSYAFGGNRDDEGIGIAVSDDGRVAITGYYKSGSEFYFTDNRSATGDGCRTAPEAPGTGKKGAFIALLSETGKCEQLKIINQSDYDQEGFGVAFDGDGYLVASGNFQGDLYFGRDRDGQIWQGLEFKIRDPYLPQLVYLQYTNSALAGNETISITETSDDRIDVVIGIEDGVSTPAQVKEAIEDDLDASDLMRTLIVSGGPATLTINDTDPDTPNSPPDPEFPIPVLLNGFEIHTTDNSTTWGYITKLNPADFTDVKWVKSVTQGINTGGYTEPRRIAVETRYGNTWDFTGIRAGSSMDTLGKGKYIKLANDIGYMWFYVNNEFEQTDPGLTDIELKGTSIKVDVGKDAEDWMIVDAAAAALSGAGLGTYIENIQAAGNILKVEYTNAVVSESKTTLDFTNINGTVSFNNGGAAEKIQFSNGSAYVWFNVDLGNSDPGGTGTPIEVNISSGDSEATAANNAALAIDASGVPVIASASSSDSKITVNFKETLDTNGPAKFFMLADGIGYVWFYPTDGGGNETDPDLSGEGIKVEVTLLDDDETIAEKTVEAINAAVVDEDIDITGVLSAVQNTSTPKRKITVYYDTNIVSKSADVFEDEIYFPTSSESFNLDDFITGDDLDVAGAAPYYLSGNNTFYIWFNVIDGDTTQSDPAPAGEGKGVEVEVLEGDSLAAMVKKAQKTLSDYQKGRYAQWDSASGDLNFRAVDVGSAPNKFVLSFADGVSPGNEYVNVNQIDDQTHITFYIKDGVTTAQTILDVLSVNKEASELIRGKLVGGPTDVQSAETMPYLADIDPNVDTDVGLFKGEGTQAEITIGDIDYKAAFIGPDGNNIWIEYTDTALAGEEYAEYEYNDGMDMYEITVHMKDGVSTASAIIKAIQADPSVSLLVRATETGTGLEAQSAVAFNDPATRLSGGSEFTFIEGISHTTSTDKILTVSYFTESPLRLGSRGTSLAKFESYAPLSYYFIAGTQRNATNGISLKENYEDHVSRLSGDTNYEGYVFKLEEDSDYLWGGILTGSSDEVFTDIALDDDGNAYVSGYFTSVGGSTWTSNDGGPDVIDPIDMPSAGFGQDALVMKLDFSDGSRTWNTTIGEDTVDTDDYAYGLCLSNNDIYLVGKTDSDLFDPPSPPIRPWKAVEDGHHVPWYVKLNQSAGTIITGEIYSNPDEDDVYTTPAQTIDESVGSFNTCATPGSGKFIPSGVFQGTFDFGNGNVSTEVITSDGVDYVIPEALYMVKEEYKHGFSTTIARAAGQLAMDTDGPTIEFEVTFGEPIDPDTFTPTDIANINTTGTLGNSGHIEWEIEDSGDQTLFYVRALSIVSDGVVEPHLRAGVVFNSDGEGNYPTEGNAHLVYYDSNVPTVVINRHEDQSAYARAADLPLQFEAVFSEDMDRTSFTAADLESIGTVADANITWSVTPGSDNRTFLIEVTAIGGGDEGTIIPIMDSGQTFSDIFNTSTNNTSTSGPENIVTYDITPPSILINQAAAQADPTSDVGIDFDIIINPPLSTTTPMDVDPSTLTPAVISQLGSATVGTWSLWENTATTATNDYILRATNISQEGTIIPAIAAGAITDLAGNDNTASSTTTVDPTPNNGVDEGTDVVTYLGAGEAFVKLATAKNSSFMCGITSAGQTFCWGKASSGQTGIGAAPPDTSIPTEIDMTHGEVFTDITIGERHACALSDKGNVFCWGSTSSGQCGDGSTSGQYNQANAIDISNLVNEGLVDFEKFIDVEAGGNNTCGITNLGNTYCWGDNSQGQSALTLVFPATETAYPTEINLGDLDSAGGETFVKLAGGYDHFCGITNLGKAYCWGDDTYGQLGNGTSKTFDYNSPSAVDDSSLASGETWLEIYADYRRTCGITSQAKTYCWGSDSFGEIGDGGDDIDQHSPSPVSTDGLVTNEVFTSLGLSRRTTCGITSFGRTLCWGLDQYGSLGLDSVFGASAEVDEPYAIPSGQGALANGESFVQISGGLYFNCGITNLGNTYCWGDETDYKLGNNDDTNLTPKDVPTAQDTTNLIRIAERIIRLSSSIKTHTCGITTIGNALCWGGNDTYGLIGDGSTWTRNNVPTHVDDSILNTNETFETISAGYFTTCGTTTWGNAYCWGFDNDGDGLLGNEDAGTTEHTPYPLDISNLENGERFKEIAVGKETACGVTFLGNIFCWGNNQYGGLGTGLVLRKALIPTAIDTSELSTGENFVSVTAGYRHNCGTTNKNNTYCWGYNNDGLLGNNSEVISDIPILVDDTALASNDNEKMLFIEADEDHTCGVSNLGGNYCWGENTGGILGDGTEDDSLITVAVDTSDLADYETFVLMSAGTSHTCGISTYGDTYCWGKDTYGELGDGAGTSDSLTPQAVDVSNLDGDEHFIDLTLGHDYSCGLTSKHRVFCWGEDDGDNNQIGTGGNLENTDDNDVDEPTQVF